MQKGLIHVYYGDGKGKTTAAIGLGVRAAGRGIKVYMVQFLKTNDSGELISLRQLKNFALGDAPAVLPFYFQMTEKEKNQYKKYALMLWESAVEKAVSGEAGLIIFDEILGAISVGLLDEDLVLDFLKNKPEETELVLTGHTVTGKIEEAADYLSHITAKKHPFEKGVPARRGIEY